MHDELIPNPQKTIAFINWLTGGAQLHLEHMASDGAKKPIARRFSVGESNEAQDTVSFQNSAECKRNMYWLPNAEFLEGKRNKANLSAARFLHVDLDNKDYSGTEDEQSSKIIGLLMEEKERPKGIPEPTAVWFTGGGYQAVWSLAQSCSIEDAEKLNEALLSTLQGGAGTHDPSRLLRLPHTVNWLDDKKRKTGREPKVSFVLEPVKFDKPPKQYALEDFKLRLPKKQSSNPVASINASHGTIEVEPLTLPDDLSAILPTDHAWTKAIMTGKAPEHKAYNSRSELVYAAIHWLLGREVNAGHIISIITNSEFGISAHVLEKPNPVSYAQKQVQKALILHDVKRINEDGSISITPKRGLLPQTVDAAEYALIQYGANIYHRHGVLVRDVRLQAGMHDEGIGRATGALVLKPVIAVWLNEQFALAARWEKATKEGYMRIDPPLNVASTYLARTGEWNVPYLHGIIQSPTLRADGSVLQIPGYDQQSNLLYTPGNISFPDIKEQPSQEEALLALETLKHPLRGFSFESDADESVALVAILTALVRNMFPSAPLFAIDAPTAGTGKSLLAETIGVIVTGYKPAMVSQGKSDEENEKRLSSLLMAGDQVIVIDNCDRPIEGDFLCTMLTQETVKPRILGKSEMQQLSTQCLVIATGNNLVLSGDITRRTLLCRLNAAVERPDQLQFDFDPRDEAIQNRQGLVVAGLTILLAYISAGKPLRISKIGSFEKWNIVREALVWLGCADPAQTRDRVLIDDPQKSILVDLLKLWETAIGNKEIKLTELEAMVADNDGVKRLVVELTGHIGRNAFNARSAGKFLAKHVDRIAGGMVLQAQTDSSGTKRYRVFRTANNTLKQTQKDFGFIE